MDRQETFTSVLEATRARRPGWTGGEGEARIGSLGTFVQAGMPMWGR